MQATVRSYDPATRSGTVLLDDGVELPYDGSALTHRAVRHLRIGQRVQVRVDEGASPPHVTALTIYTLPPDR